MQHSVVVGLGKTGASCIRYLAKRGIPVSATDTRRAPPGLAELGSLAGSFDMRLGGFDLSLLDGASQLLISPGVSLEEPIARAARERGRGRGGPLGGPRPRHAGRPLLPRLRAAPRRGRLAAARGLGRAFPSPLRVFRPGTWWTGVRRHRGHFRQRIKEAVGCRSTRCLEWTRDWSL